MVKITMGKRKPIWQLSQQEIADRAEISQSLVHYILNGDKNPSPETAIKLEEATGICREGWIWPDRHHNPYIPFTNGINCMACLNRPTRSLWMFQKMVGLMSQVESGRRLKAVDGILTDAHEGMGFPNEITFGLYIKRRYDYLRVGGTGWLENLEPSPLSVPDYQFPEIIYRLRKGIPIISIDHEKDFAGYPDDLEQIKLMQIRCGFFIPYGNLVLETSVKTNGPDYNFTSDALVMGVTQMLIEMEKLFTREELSDPLSHLNLKN